MNETGLLEEVASDWFDSWAKEQHKDFQQMGWTEPEAPMTKKRALKNLRTAMLDLHAQNDFDSASTEIDVANELVESMVARFDYGLSDTDLENRICWLLKRNPMTSRVVSDLKKIYDDIPF